MISAFLFLSLSIFLINGKIIDNAAYVVGLSFYFLSNIILLYLGIYKIRKDENSDGCNLLVFNSIKNVSRCLMRFLFISVSFIFVPLATIYNILDFHENFVASTYYSNYVHDGVKGKSIGGPRCQGSCRLSEMESGVGWGRKVDIRDEALLSRT